MKEADWNQPRDKSWDVKSLTSKELNKLDFWLKKLSLEVRIVSIAPIGKIILGFHLRAHWQISSRWQGGI